MICNLEYYRTFFMTANFLSFTKAADQLCLTQPAVSQSVKKLEVELGCNLFTRSSHGLELTKEGTVLYEHVKKAFAELQTGERQLNNMTDLKMGELKIGATETSLHLFLASKLPEIRQRFPKISISFAGSTIRDTCQKLQSGEIEAAFLISPIPPEFQFQLTNIGSVQDVPVAGPSFPMDFGRTYTQADLANYPLIAVEEGNSVRDYIEQWFLEYNVLFTPEFTVRSTGLVLPLVEQNLGIGILPENFVSKKIADGELKQIMTQTAIKPRTLYLAINPLQPVSAICNQFLELFQTV
ncbi:MAG: LysR family transcriptional regulator [Clostridiales bacterium]|nr:LysR family transcriptional regulator [Clostridiales bacterium]